MKALKNKLLDYLYIIFITTFCITPIFGMDEKDRTSAAPTLLSQQEYAEEQFQLGHSYDIEENDLKAIEHYTNAGNQGHTEAQSCLGWMYENGEGAEQNIPEAIKWHKKAGKGENIDSLFALGKIYEEGKGVEKNPSKAIKYYTKAAAGGHEAAKFNLEVMEEYKDVIFPTSLPQNE
jgi:TPR repeat protein